MREKKNYKYPIFTLFSQLEAFQIITFNVSKSKQRADALVSSREPSWGTHWLLDALKISYML
jgi:hypothetical protein